MYMYSAMYTANTYRRSDAIVFVFVCVSAITTHISACDVPVLRSRSEGRTTGYKNVCCGFLWLVGSALCWLSYIQLYIHSHSPSSSSLILPPLSFHLPDDVRCAKYRYKYIRKIGNRKSRIYTVYGLTVWQGTRVTEGG